MNGVARAAIGRSLSFSAGLVLALALVLLPSDAAAQWGGEVRGQMGFGGDPLASVEYSDGSDSDLKLGTYFTFSLGPIFEAWSSGPSSIELQAMVGWSGWSTGPQNTEDRLKLNRFPLELLAFYGHRLPGRDMTIRVGGGATYHAGGGVSGSGALDGFDMDIENALGFTGEVSVISGILTGGLRYTHMSNTVVGLPGSMSGSSFALFLGLTTPRT